MMSHSNLFTQYFRWFYLFLLFPLILSMPLYGAEMKIEEINLDRQTMKEHFQEVLGDQKNPLPALLNGLEHGMSCKEVQKTFPTTDGCTDSKRWQTAKAVLSNNPLVNHVNFYFDNDQLNKIEMVFKVKTGSTMGKQFKDVSVDVMESKWGAIPEASDKDDIITLYADKKSTDADKRTMNNTMGNDKKIRIERATVDGYWAILVMFPKK